MAEWIGSDEDIQGVIREAASTGALRKLLTHVNAVRRGVSATDEAVAALTAASEAEPIGPGITSLLDAFVRARAEQLSISPNLLCPSGVLPQLVRDARAGAESTVGLMTGWRRELVGRDLTRLAQGQAAIRIDPATGKVVIEQVRGASPS